MFVIVARLRIGRERHISLKAVSARDREAHTGTAKIGHDPALIRLTGKCLPPETTVCFDALAYRHPLPYWC
jgi:hypothetical protein